MPPAGRPRPYDVAVDKNGNVYASTVQPLGLFLGGSKILQLSPTGSPLLTISDAAGAPFNFPDAAVDAAGNIWVGDGFLGLLKYGPDGKLSGQWQVPATGQAAFAVRVAPSGNIYTLACNGINGACTLAEYTPDMQPVATWHASTVVDHPGTMVDVGGNKVYVQCVGSGSPTIVWIAGAAGPGWLNSAQYLMGKLAETSRFCTYDRPGLGWSEPGPYDDVSHWSQAVADLHTALGEGRREGSVRDDRSLVRRSAREVVRAHVPEGRGGPGLDRSGPRGRVGRTRDGPTAPFGITTCTDASCPLFGDIQAIKKLEGGKVAGSLGDLPLVVLSHAPDLPFWNAGIRRDLGEARGRHRDCVIQCEARDRVVVHPPDPVHAARPRDRGGEASGDGGAGIQPRAARVRPGLHGPGRAVPVGHSGPAQNRRA